MRVLLTSPRAPATLELARHFAANGDTVFCCDSLHYPAARFSRNVQRCFHTPRPVEDNCKYIQALNEIIREQMIDLLVPTCEEVFYLGSARGELGCSVFCDAFEKLSSIHNKWEFSQHGSNSAAAVPESFLLQSSQDLEPYHEQSQDFVFKPVFSRFASETLIRPNFKQLKRIEVGDHKPWIAQRFINGQELSTYSIASEGKLLAHCCYRSFFRAGKGSGICFQAVDEPSVHSYVTQFVERLSFSGQIGFDFIRDTNHQLWVLEGNPRATSGVHLFESSQNLGRSILKRGTEVIAKPVKPHMVGAAMIPFGLLDAAKRRTPLLFLKKLVSSRDVLFRLRDPLPFLCLPLTIAELAWIALLERRSLQEASTFDIEWNGQQL